MNYVEHEQVEMQNKEEENTKRIEKAEQIKEGKYIEMQIHMSRN